MGSRHLLAIVLALAFAELSASCATTKSVGNNIQRVYNGQPVDRQGLTQALSSDTKTMEANLVVLRRKFDEAYAALRNNVQQRWGQKDTKIANRTVYVKYTQGYESRVVTDFDHGVLTVETLDDKNPQGSLKSTIIAALLTSNDPGTVDLFSDKAVTLDPSMKPYLYGLVHDNQGKPIRTRAQAEKFADYLIAQKVQTRPVQSEQGNKTAHYVTLLMVKNFEAKNAERYRPTVEKYAAQYNVSPSLMLAIMRTESNFNPFAVSGAPAYGLMQLVPPSAGRDAYKRAYGVDQTPTPDYLFDPDHNIELAAAYLNILTNTDFRAVANDSSRDYCVVAAYNTGSRNVTRVFANDKTTALNDINGMDPPALFDRLRTDLPMEETRKYVVTVTGYRKQFVSADGTAPVTAMQ